MAGELPLPDNVDEPHIAGSGQPQTAGHPQVVILVQLGARPDPAVAYLYTSSHETFMASLSLEI